MKINIEKVVEEILQQMYFDEFEVIDGLSRHPKGMNFYDWLFNRSFISEEDYRKKLNEIDD